MVLLRHMRTNGPTPGVKSYNAAINACTKNGLHEDGLSLLRDMQSRGPEPNAITYSTLVDGCAKKGEGEEGLRLLREMRKKGLKPGTAAYNAVMDGFIKTDRVRDALELLKEMRSTTDIVVNLITYCTAMYGCAGSGLGREGIALLDEIKALGLQPDMDVLKAAIECTKYIPEEDGHGIADSLFGEMLDLGFVKTAVTYSTSTAGADEPRRLPLLDLHDHTEVMAKAAVRLWLLKSSETDGAFGLITGHAESREREGVLRTAMMEYMQAAGHDCHIDPTNRGVLLVRAKSPRTR